MGNINMWLKLIKTSKICHSLNGNVFKFKDMIPGVNAHRRSTTVPHVGNWRNKFFNERKGKYQTENKVMKKKNYKNRQKEMLDMIHSGKIRIDINPENKIDIVKIIDF